MTYLIGFLIVLLVVIVTTVSFVLIFSDKPQNKISQKYGNRRMSK